jgi:hypothetical protein
LFEKVRPSAIRFHDQPIAFQHFFGRFKGRKERFAPVVAALEGKPVAGRGGDSSFGWDLVA